MGNGEVAGPAFYGAVRKANDLPASTGVGLQKEADARTING